MPGESPWSETRTYNRKLSCGHPVASAVSAPCAPSYPPQSVRYPHLHLLPYQGRHHSLRCVNSIPEECRRSQSRRTARLCTGLAHRQLCRTVVVRTSLVDDIHTPYRMRNPRWFKPRLYLHRPSLPSLVPLNLTTRKTKRQDPYCESNPASCHCFPHPQLPLLLQVRP